MKRIPRKIKKALRKAGPGYPQTKWVRRSYRYYRKTTKVMVKIACQTALAVSALERLRGAMIASRYPKGGYVPNVKQ